MQRITELELKEKTALDEGLENPLNEIEKSILADYRKEYGISDPEDEESGAEKKEKEDDIASDDSEDDSGAEEEKETSPVEKIKAKKIEEEQPAGRM